jgi:hypothetical protein
MLMHYEKFFFTYYNKITILKKIKKNKKIKIEKIFTWRETSREKSEVRRELDEKRGAFESFHAEGKAQVTKKACGIRRLHVYWFMWVRRSFPFALI